MRLEIILCKSERKLINLTGGNHAVKHVNHASTLKAEIKNTKRERPEGKCLESS